MTADRASLALAQHVIAKRSLDFFWRALTNLGAPAKTVNVTTPTTPVVNANTIETDFKKMLGHGPFKRDVKRHRRSIHELHKLLKEQNDQLQRLLRTLPGGNLLSPVLAHNPQQHGIFNPLALSNTLLFVNHDPKNDTEQKPKGTDAILTAPVPPTPAPSTVAPEATTSTPTTTVVAVEPKKATEPSGNPTSATVAPAPSSGSTTVAIPVTTSAAEAAPAATSTSEAAPAATSTSEAAPIAPREADPSSTTASSTTSAATSSTAAPAAPTTVAEVAGRQAALTTVPPVVASSGSPVEVTSEVEGSGSLPEDHTGTVEPQINIL